MEGRELSSMRWGKKEIWPSKALNCKHDEFFSSSVAVGGRGVIEETSSAISILQEARLYAGDSQLPPAPGCQRRELWGPTRVWVIHAGEHPAQKLLSRQQSRHT